MTGHIEFRNVRFRYPARPKLRILRNLNLACESGATTALVGPSGSGKSTTVGLIERFYDPLTGTVLLDGHDIRTLNIAWLRSLMGLVQQEPVLFNLSVRENIAYGDNARTVTQAEIEAAARKANIHDTIAGLPQVSDLDPVINIGLPSRISRAMRHLVVRKGLNCQVDKNKEVSLIFINDETLFADEFSSLSSCDCSSSCSKSKDSSSG